MVNMLLRGNMVVRFLLTLGAVSQDCPICRAVAYAVHAHAMSRAVVGTAY